MQELNYQTITKTYDRDTFGAELLASGIPMKSIDALLRAGMDSPSHPLLKWLHEDILKNETKIKDGKRIVQFVGIYCTDGSHVLVEREQDYIAQNDTYHLGGLLPFGKIPLLGAMQELREETPLTPIQKNFTYVGSMQQDKERKKLPHVMTERLSFFFRYDVPSLSHLNNYTHHGIDNVVHELITISPAEVLRDPRVGSGFKELILKYQDKL